VERKEVVGAEKDRGGLWEVAGEDEREHVNEGGKVGGWGRGGRVGRLRAKHGEVAEEVSVVRKRAGGSAFAYG
jgi:hypothetical protein